MISPNGALLGLRFLSIMCLWTSGASAQESPKTIENPTGGTIIYGQLVGQPTMREAMTRILYRISQKYSDQPQVGRMLKNNTGEVLAAFFSLTAKSEGNRAVAGVAIISVPHAGPVEGAMISDNADRFPKTFNSLFQRLLTEAGAATGTQARATSSTFATAASAPAAALRVTPFPDGSGSVGLPSGWSIISADKGDVLAKGAQGERLRFGMAASFVDPRSPQAATLTRPTFGVPSNLIALPYGADPVVAFKAVVAHRAQSSHRPVPIIKITDVKTLPSPGGGRNFLLGGDCDWQDGAGSMAMVMQLGISEPMPMGWQMNIFQVVLPKQLAAQEMATALAMLRSYQANAGVIIARIGAEVQFTNGVFKTAMQRADQIQDSSARSTQGMSDLLREQTLLRNTETGQHVRAGNDLADELVNQNPNKWEVVPLSQYQRGRDY